MPAARFYDSSSGKAHRKRRRKNGFSLLEDNLFYLVFGYLDVFEDLLPLSQCSKPLREAVLTNRIWGDIPVDMCISKTCFECGRNKLSLSTARAICSRTCLEFVRLHLTLPTIPSFVEALSERNTVKRMHLRIAPLSGGSTVTLLKMQSLPADVRLHLESLIVYDWPKQPSSISVVDFLARLGDQLLSLKFMEGAPFDVLQAVTRHCPVLQTLAVEGRQQLEDLQAFVCPSLTTLSLYETGCRLSGSLALPTLQRLEFANSELDLPSSVQETMSFIAALPVGLKEVDLKVSCSFANPTITAIARRLPDLESLILRLALGHAGHDNLPQDISQRSMQILQQGCPKLTSLELAGEFVSLESAAFIELAHFTQLRRLKTIYDDVLVDCLPRLLREAEYLEEVTFYENASDFLNEEELGAGAAAGVAGAWEQMEERLQAISEQFPAVRIALTDSWWT